MSGLLGQLGSWCARHGKAVLALWVVAAVLLTAGSVFFPGPVSNNVSIPGTDAQRAVDLMKDGFGPGYEGGGIAPSLEIGIIAIKLEGNDTAKLAETTKLLSAAAEPAREAGIEA